MTTFDKELNSYLIDCEVEAQFFKTSHKGIVMKNSFLYFCRFLRFMPTS